MQRFLIFAALIAASERTALQEHRRSGAEPDQLQAVLHVPYRAHHLFTCPDNTCFNPRTLACDSTNKVRCEPGDIPTSILTSSLKALPANIEHTVTACINQPVATCWPTLPTVAAFYQCSITGAINFQCPAGTCSMLTARMFLGTDPAAVASDRSAIATDHAPSLPIVPPVPMPMPQPAKQPEQPADAVPWKSHSEREIRNPSNCSD
ncbi:uncharacterized protein LOC121602128, partial [Anopheles merus]|uniref:uncharacterized protein LOC121602128 n=1 Tax=Anopheles merus TaxID=30066 RepID=UPI001BE44609